MQILLIISFGMTVLASLFIGNAFSGGYSPYFAGLAALLSLIALFMPFLSEYNVLHRGFSKIGENFKSLIGTEQHVKGDVEIIMPGQSRTKAETYGFEKKVTGTHVGVVIILIIAVSMLGYDAVNFYILGDGMETNTGPISNF